MHALMGIKSYKYSFTITVMFGNVSATSLIDSDITSTFITPNIAYKQNCVLTSTKCRDVMVANGGTLWTEFIALECPFSIQGAYFASDFSVLKLQGYDVIFGVDWICLHIPVQLDFEEMHVQVTMPTGEKLIFQDESLPTVAI